MGVLCFIRALKKKKNYFPNIRRTINTYLTTMCVYYNTNDICITRIKKIKKKHYGQRNNVNETENIDWKTIFEYEIFRGNVFIVVIFIVVRYRPWRLYYTNNLEFYNNILIFTTFIIICIQTQWTVNISATVKVNSKLTSANYITYSLKKEKQ